jgi:TolB-like protein
MKNSCKWIICFICAAFLAPSLLWAKEKYSVAVLPFSVNSMENIDYVQRGIGVMLSSRLSISEKITVISPDAILTALKEVGGKELVLADIYTLGKKLNADFTVWGSITKIGNSLSIDGTLVDISANKSTVAIVAQIQNMDELIPRINDFSQKIETHIVGTPSPATGTLSAPKETVAVAPPPSQPSAQNIRDAEIISGMKSSKKGTFTASINPDFINAAQPIDSKTFWKSQQLSTEFKGVDIGDVNGDGLNETVIIDNRTVFIYQKKGGEFKLIQQLTGGSYENYIGVDVADINGNGIKEIFVSNYVNGIVNSFVIEFRNGKFETIASNLRWFMRVIDTSSGIPILLGQRRGMEKPFDTPIYEIRWQGGEYLEGRKMRIPEGLSVYGLTLDQLGSSGEEKIIVIDRDDYLNVFESTDKPLSRVAVFGGSKELIWKSEDVFGGSSTKIDPRYEATKDEKDSEIYINYINLRIVPYDTNKNGKREIIVVKNISTVARTLQQAKFFTSAEVYNLEWDGMGMVENWRTKKISGYVADYQIKDIDNDGENEVVLALVLSTSGLTKGRSVIVSYSLKGQ